MALAPIFSSIFPKKSRARRLQYEWAISQKKCLESTSKVLDLGGVRGAEYHEHLGLTPDRILVWNLDKQTAPDALVDLDKAAEIPAFPEDCCHVIALNLLEHLFHPFHLLEWACAGLPKGGQILILVPFAYPLHPSPQDYWRIAPQAFERFFEEQKKCGNHGVLKLDLLGSDYREAVGGVTSAMFKGSKRQRIVATFLEWIAHFFSLITGSSRARKWAETYPSSIGVLWTKS